MHPTRRFTSPSILKRSSSTPSTVCRPESKHRVAPSAHAVTGKRGRPFPTLHWGVEWPDIQGHGSLAELRMNESLVLSPVTVAEQDEPLVMALAGTGSRGVFSTGFAVCLAVILRDEAGVGLLHTSQGEEPLPAIIQEAQEDFFEKTGRHASVTIGYFPDGLRDELRDQLKAIGSERFLASEASRYDASLMPPGSDTVGQADWAIDQILANHVQEVQAAVQHAREDAGRLYTVTAMRMSGCMVAVETNGKIHGMAP